MAVSIDNVYQRVLAISNKEQRGYITPQEFNLLAYKAQMDIFESYFHDYKIALLNPGNQSKTADNIEILREKIAVHRVVGDDITFPPDSIGLKAPGILPANVHWLESVYGGSEGEIGNHKIVRVKFGDANVIDTSGELSTNDSRLRLYRYDPQQSGSNGEGTALFHFITEDGVYTETVVENWANEDLPPHWIVYIEENMTGAQVASEFATVVNSDDPYHRATIDPADASIVEIYYLQNRIWELTGPENYEGFFNYPGSAILNIAYDRLGVTDAPIYEEVNRQDFEYIKRNKKLIPTTGGRAIFCKQNKGLDIDLIPHPGIYGNTKCDYIKKPADPKWTYVVVNNRALYNASASDKQDFELHASEESSLTNKILELAGIVVNKPGLSEVVLRNEQMKEAKENR